jgi:hypothetical protein
MYNNAGSLRRNRDFRRLLYGSTISMLGSRLTTICYPMLILFLHGSPMIAGFAVFAANAPSVLVYIPAGALVDRWDDPRRTLLLAEAGRGVAIGTIVCLLLFHRAGIPLIIVMAIIEESLEVFATLAERRYVRLLVGSTQASGAQISIIEARAHVVVLAGRALGGLLFGIWQVLPFLADAASFTVSVAAVLGSRRRMEPSVRRPPAPRLYLVGEVRDGLRELFMDGFARPALLFSAGMTLVSQALIIVFLAQEHSGHVPSVVIGSVLAVSGIGGLLGALVGQRFLRPFGRSPLKLQPRIWAIMLLVFAVSGRWQIPVMALVMMVFGLVGAMGNVELDTYLNQKVPDKKLGRVTSIEMLLDFAAAALGPVLGGLLTELYGTGNAVWALLGFTAVLVVLGFRMPPVPVTAALVAAPAPSAIASIQMVSAARRAPARVFPPLAAGGGSGAARAHAYWPSICLLTEEPRQNGR